MIREYSRLIAVAIFTVALFVSSLSAETPKLSGGTMNAIAETYVKLVLAMGQHDADYVDAYYGPAEWKDAAAKEKKAAGCDWSRGEAIARSPGENSCARR